MIEKIKNCEQVFHNEKGEVVGYISDLKIDKINELIDSVNNLTEQLTLIQTVLKIKQIL